jgi:ubiquinone/menaquinone biosynthesis C-methylase UbiE
MMGRSDAMSQAANLFDDGEAYERLMGRWSRLAGEKFLDWLGAAKDLKWVDVGCGNGAFTELLIERCAPASVVGVDPSEGQLAYARTRGGAKRAEFRIADAQSLPFPDNSFDAGAMALVIVFVPDAVKAAAEMARVVRPGGVVATYMWDFPDGTPLSPLSRAIKALGFEPPERPNVQAAARDSMQAIWREAGLKSVETEVLRIGVEFSNFDDFWDSNTLPIGPSGKALAALSPSARQQLKARLRAQMSPAADGTIAYESVANAVRGVAP